MDVFFEGLSSPSTSTSSDQTSRPQPHMIGDTEHNLSTEKATCGSMSEIQEDHLSCLRMNNTMLSISHAKPTPNSAFVSSTLSDVYCSSRIEYISTRVQELVEKINCSRTSDQKVMDSFQEKLSEKVSETCQQMKELMYAVYDENSNEMQMKLQELTEVLESCTKLNNELLEASRALASLREGLAISQMAISP